MSGLLQHFYSVSQFYKGVSGLTTGGGYSYKTNQLGLVSDNTVEYELVTYTGEILNVTSASYPDLFFGLQVCYYEFYASPYKLFETGRAEQFRNHHQIHPVDSPSIVSSGQRITFPPQILC